MYSTCKSNQMALSLSMGEGYSSSECPQIQLWRDWEVMEREGGDGERGW